LRKAHPRKTIWILHELPRLREKIAIEMETWSVNCTTLPEVSAELTDGAIADP
jgi:hypothetical protein